jgi:hypothetical protein
MKGEARVLKVCARVEVDKNAVPMGFAVERGHGLRGTFTWFGTRVCFSGAKRGTQTVRVGP